MITKLKIENLTAFDAIELDFSSKINVIIGENGTGKTHILKLCHAVCSIYDLLGDNKPSMDCVSKAITSKLLDYFKPFEDKLLRIKRNGSKANASVSIDFDHDGNISFSFGPRSKSVKIDNKSDEFNKLPSKSLFIPAKEVLSFLHGITDKSSDSKTISTIFDGTYIDLCNSLIDSKPNDYIEKIDSDPRYGTILTKISDIIGGKFEFNAGSIAFCQGKYESNASNTKTIYKKSGTDISNNMTAEGYRKVGVLQQLIANESLNPGVSGALLWDEPEANMNPKLMRLLVEILLELSRNGQQIILATHDYVLLKWFDLLVDKGKEDHVCFHVLHKEEQTGNVKIKSTDDYSTISKNSISDTFAELYDHDIARALGGKDGGNI